jgi:hypothetical protein
MSHHYALLSIVFMMSFVALFDRKHVETSKIRFCKNGLMSQEDIHHLLSILSACQD